MNDAETKRLDDGNRAKGRLYEGQASSSLIYSSLAHHVGCLSVKRPRQLDHHWTHLRGRQNLTLCFLPAPPLRSWRHPHQKACASTNFCHFLVAMWFEVTTRMTTLVLVAFFLWRSRRAGGGRQPMWRSNNLWRM